MTTEEDLIFDELYPMVKEDFHTALDSELDNVIEEYGLSTSMAIKMIETFYSESYMGYPEIHKTLKKEDENAKKKAS